MKLVPVVMVLVSIVADRSEAINPIPRAARQETIARWDFDDGVAGWVPERHCSLSAAEGVLRVTATGEDPFFHCQVSLPGGRTALQLRARTSTAASCSIYWTTDRQPTRGEDKARHFRIIPDGKWHEYSVTFEAPGTLRDLRIDPGAGAGVMEIDWIELAHAELHPLVIEQVKQENGRVEFVVWNDSQQPVSFQALGRQYELAPDGRTILRTIPPAERPLEEVTMELSMADWPPLRRTVFVFHPEVEAEWITRQEGEARLEVAPDGTVARLHLADRLVAAFAPVVHFDGKIPHLTLDQSSEGESKAIVFSGPGVRVSLRLNGADVHVSISADRQCEGPVVRVFGPLEQGLFAGLEHLGRGERSSSKLDVETPEHIRFAPDPMKVTMPLMAFVTDTVGVALSWDEMELQPVYATPNFFDGTSGHRMALRGRQIDALVHMERTTLEELILWAVGRKGLPPLPPAPRSERQQWELCMRAFNGPLRNENGWGHCVEDRWARRPYADIASTIFRITGTVPDLPRIVPGGAHVRNECIYFLTGRAAQWKAEKQRQIESILRQQKPDGSFRYSGKYARGHFEDTASGVCARPAVALLEYARITGDQGVLRAAVRTLEYMKRFRTPRGAQVWEIPLHTPDQLASAYLVWAYVRGYELTGDRSYLAEARRWALSGVPFVYLWSNKPVMLYATVPVLGATNWKAPCWMGLPVQWVGGVYAYALTLLAPYDDSLDWNHLARGILISAEQQQVPEGQYAGLLPDSFVLASQRRNPPLINPAAIAALRMALDGRLVDLDVATDAAHRVAAPFPVEIRQKRAIIQGKPGITYQILLDGEKIVDVESQGTDVIPLP